MKLGMKCTERQGIKTPLNDTGIRMISAGKTQMTGQYGTMKWTAPMNSIRASLTYKVIPQNDIKHGALPARAPCFYAFTMKIDPSLSYPSFS
jgi:hypothetical protein